MCCFSQRRHWFGRASAKIWLRHALILDHGLTRRQKKKAQQPLWVQCHARSHSYNKYIFWKLSVIVLINHLLSASCHHRSVKTHIISSYIWYLYSFAQIRVFQLPNLPTKWHKIHFSSKPHPFFQATNKRLSRHPWPVGWGQYVRWEPRGGYRCDRRTDPSGSQWGAVVTGGVQSLSRRVVLLFIIITPAVMAIYQL